MDNNGYLILMSVIAAVLFGCSFYIFHKKSWLNITLGMITTSAAVILVSYMVGLFCPDHLSSSIFYSIYFIANTWLCLSIYLFAYVYTGQKYNSMALKISSLVLMAIDNISLICNAWTNHEVLYTFVKENNLQCWEFKGTWVFYFPFGFLLHFPDCGLSTDNL
ncbi:MAG: hypothetical protein LKJ88_08460 [Bacilli bacterium]|jgi:hypothetical protein|nr:hypothetical protein [Bacilli bacterium]